MIKKKEFNTLKISAMVYLGIDSVVSIHNLEHFFINERQYIVLTRKKVIDMEEEKEIDDDNNYIFDSKYWKEIQDFFVKNPNGNLLVYF